MDSSKVIWFSKTFWIAFLVFGASILKLTGVVDLPVDDGAAWMGFALSIIQVLLRLVTKQPVVLKVIALLFLPLALSYCSNTKEIVKQQELKIAPQEINAEMPAIKYDDYVQGVQVKYFPVFENGKKKLKEIRLLTCAIIQQKNLLQLRQNRILYTIPYRTQLNKQLLRCRKYPGGKGSDTFSLDRYS